MRALSLITIKPGTIDQVTELLSKKRKIAKEVLPVTGRADICVLMNGSFPDIPITRRERKKRGERGEKEKRGGGGGEGGG